MPRLPLLACFHGGGSNAEIYSIQCARLGATLEHDFELVFFDAPFVRPAGPGVLPIFQDFGPFRAWFSQGPDGADLVDGSGFDDARSDGVERVVRLMEKRAPLGEWVGVVGFSQGSRVAGGLLWDQQCRRERGLEARTKLRFGVLCMGGKEPMVSRVVKDSIKSGSVENVSEEEMISIPTLHLHGLKDQYLPYGRRQLEAYYRPGSTTLYEINYHHAMPWVTEEINRLAELIREKNDSKYESPSPVVSLH